MSEEGVSKGVTVDEALALVRTEREKRWQACWDEVRAAVEKHNCVLTADAALVPLGNGYYRTEAQVVLRVEDR